MTFQAPVLAQGASYKDRIFLAGKDYFWNIVFEGWNRKDYDWSLMQNVYVYNDYSRSFDAYIQLPGSCQKVAAGASGAYLSLIHAVTPAGKQTGEHYLRILDLSGNKVVEIPKGLFQS